MFVRGSSLFCKGGTPEWGCPLRFHFFNRNELQRHPGVVKGNPPLVLYTLIWPRPSDPEILYPIQRRDSTVAEAASSLRMQHARGALPIS